jgi:pyocin large subunit-like protein
MTTDVARKPRPRRIAADEAHSWARHLKLGNPYAKLVLSMLTIYVNGDGSCFVGIEQLAEDTELSADTVRKRLAWLERVGAIARFPQWIDASGRRNGDGRGKSTSDEIRLLTMPIPN